VIVAGNVNLTAAQRADPNPVLPYNWITGPGMSVHGAGYGQLSIADGSAHLTTKASFAQYLIKGDDNGGLHFLFAR
jgi:hypothetical protein